MDQKLAIVKGHLERICMKLNDGQWTHGSIKVIFPPTINIGYKTQPKFFDRDGNKLRLIPEYDELFEKDLFSLIIAANEVKDVNEIVFEINRDPVVSSVANLQFNQQVVDNFNENLTQSQRGKTVAWYKQKSI